MKKNIIYTIFAVLILLSGCKEEDFPVPQSREIAASFTVTFDPDNYAPSSVTFTSTTATSENAGTLSYIWNFGDGNTGSGATATHEYESPGDYNVSLIVQSSNDLDFATKTVTIRDATALLVDIYFMDAGSLTINNLDGESFAVDGFGQGLDYDPINQKLYFTDDDNQTLVSSDLDGTNQTVVASGFSSPRDLALDVDAQFAYVVDRGVNGIIRVNLANGTKTNLYTTAELPEAIDFYDGNLYWTCVEIDAESVWKAPSAGGAAPVSPIIDYSGGGYGYGIAIDKANGKIYFDDTDSGQIRRANLDGTSVEPVIDTANRAYGIVIDNTNEKMYWTERNSGNVYMANLDGTNKVTIGSGFTDPRGLIFIE